MWLLLKMSLGTPEMMTYLDLLGMTAARPPLLFDVAITGSERYFLLIIQAYLDTEEVYAQMTLQPVNTVSI